MNGKQLKNSILQWAIQGKLVPQDPNDEPASVLLDKIRQEKERLIKEKKIKRDKNASIIYRGEDNSYYEKMLATGEVKCIDEEIPFDVPQGWEWERWGNIAQTIQYGYNAPALEHGVIKMVRISDIQENCVLWDNVPYCLIDENDIDTYLLKVNDILFARTGGTVGKSFLVEEVPEKAIYAGYLIRTRYSSLLNPRYMKSFMESQLYWEQLKNGTIATAQPNCNGKTLAKMLLPIPPTKEQDRIVKKLTQLSSFLDNYGLCQDRLNLLNEEIKEQLKKSILQEAIQGKLVPQLAEEGTAQDLLEQIKMEKLNLVKEGKLKKSALATSVIFRGDDNKYYEQIGKKCLDITEQIPFEIPSNWEWCRVRNVSNSYIGLTYKPTDIDEKGTIVLRSCNIRNGKLALDDIVRVSSSISEKLLIEENDIIICARNGSKRLVGKSALIRNLSEPMTFGAFMAICKTPIYEYMFAYLQSDLFFGQLRDVSNTTTINQLTQNKFNDFLIPIPPIREQERIAFKISQLFQKLR
ncbi:MULTISPECIES: restriction endonuclease subunit S [Bacteroides]|uniref:restriction endonuclease subunit S n=1 Tax=Bacteroides TaxID=816 RepID=UPI001C37B648|nr:MULTISPECIES: restriction endonuclease subunit S [Bacteroides]MBV4352625.1 restriction endonuclease subunit S [Bacteroides uniformis]MBV4361937.1 restriction endonuclease subunit S [Bacteroides uniformis]MCB6318684.1 restriction endonuclease subunit S [Bacteroides thetaiotaomicron]MCB7437303.1 restriction endonuclease subunit S [Bacteroides thetaiotaomicron]MCG4963974.1 restriction endonuclease subunit S [Bacteroides uniformis]